MSLLQARVTARRFRVVGDLPDEFREMFRTRLNEFAFIEPPVVEKEVHGWTLVDDLTETDFTDFNTWYVDQWILFALRIDKRVIPSQMFNATLKKMCREWAEERNLKRCPASVRSEIKDELERSWLAKVMPRTQHTQLCWNLRTGTVYISSHADLVCDTIRKRFYRTFGLKLMPFSPFEWVKDDPELVSNMLVTSPMSLNTFLEDVLVDALTAGIINASRSKGASVTITLVDDEEQGGEE